MENVYRIRNEVDDQKLICFENTPLKPFKEKFKKSNDYVVGKAQCFHLMHNKPRYHK